MAAGFGKVCLATEFVDALIEFHGASKEVDGPEKQLRGSIGIGGNASDLEPEQGYLTPQAVETDGVQKGVLLILCKARRVEAMGAGVLVAKRRTTPTPLGLLGAFQ